VTHATGHRGKVLGRLHIVGWGRPLGRDREPLVFIGPRRSGGQGDPESQAREPPTHGPGRVSARICPLRSRLRIFPIPDKGSASRIRACLGTL